MAFDEVGQADTYERRIEICKRSYDILVQKVGFPAEDIIFDPNIFPVATGMEEHRKNAIDFFKATKWIRENLPCAHVSGGVSNVSFSFRGNDKVREAMHSVFLFHAIQHGIVITSYSIHYTKLYDTFNDDNEGTLISAALTSEGIKSLSVLPDVSLINFEGRGLLGKTGVDARIFKVMADNDISVSIISQGSSERGIGIVVITSYSIHYTKLYEIVLLNKIGTILLLINAVYDL